MINLTEYRNIVNLICIIFGFLLESLATRDFFDFLLKRRYRPGYYYAYMILLTVLAFLVRVVFGLQMGGLLICFACSMLFVYFMYEGTNIRKAGVVLLLCVICILFDSLGLKMEKYLMIHVIGGADQHMAYFAYISLFTKLELLLVIDILGSFIGEGKNKLSKKTGKLLVNLMPIGLIVTAAIDYCRLMFVKDISVWDQFGMVALSLIGLIACFEEEYLFQYYKGKEQMLQMEAQIMAQVSYLESLTDTHNKFRQLSHDVRNQLSVVHSLLAMESYEEAKEYLRKVSAVANKNVLPVVTNNVVIDALLNQEYVTADAKGIHMEFHIEDLGELYMEVYDMVTILMNALKNATNASMDVKPRHRNIGLKITNQPHETVICVKNKTSIKEKKLKGGFLPDTKEDMEKYGNGLMAVKRVVDHYHGSLHLSWENYSFQMVAVIPGNKS